MCLEDTPYTMTAFKGDSPSERGTFFWLQVYKTGSNIFVI